MFFKQRYPSAANRIGTTQFLTEIRQLIILLAHPQDAFARNVLTDKAATQETIKLDVIVDEWKDQEGRINRAFPDSSQQACGSALFHQQVTLQQTSTWVSVKFSTLIKILAEKQEATELFIEEQREAAITEAEARLAELEERSQILRESLGQIAAVQHLPDTELIKVCTPAFICYHSFFFIMQKSNGHKRFQRTVQREGWICLVL